MTAPCWQPQAGVGQRCQSTRHQAGVQQLAAAWERAEQTREAQALADELGVPLVSNPVARLGAVAHHRGRDHPDCRELGIGQIVFSPIAQGVVTGKYQPGQRPPEGSRATDEQGNGAEFIRRLLRDDSPTLTPSPNPRP
jgi:aryl-alcohol dehydrogenase-like predicted oxidoreductase